MFSIGTETKDAFDEGVQLVAESYDKISTVAKGYKAGFKLSEFNERRLRFIKAAKALFKKPGDEELKTEFSQADKELIDYVLTYTEELLAQIDVGDTMGRPKRSFCSSGGSASCGEDGGDASEMEYSILAADNETLNDELASREETISRLTERISALEQLNKEQCQVVEQLSRENAMLLERRIDAFAGDSKSAADELVAQLRSEAAVVAKSNAELTKTLEAMKAEEVRLGLLLKAEEAQRAELERECDRIYEASQQLCAAQIQQQNGKSGGGSGNGINSALDKKSRRKSRRQCRGMSFAVDGLTAASSPQQQQQPSRAVMSSTTEKLIELLCSIVPGFSESWAQLSKDDVRVVDKAVRSLGKSGISGGGGNSNNNSSSSRGDSSSGNSRGDEPFSYAALVTGKALRAWPDAVWAWERAVYAAELGRKLAFHRKPPLTLRESTRRGELVSVAAELGARLGKAVGSMLLALSSKRALPHRRMTVCGSGPDIEYFESVGENNNSGVNDLKAYFAAEEIDNELIGVRTALMTLITRVRELAKETDVAGPEKPKVERVYDQIENDIRCLGVKGTPDANIIAQASGDSVALGVRAQLVRSLDEDSASANICASRIFAIVSAGYKYTRSYNGGGGGGPYGAMLWELSTTALRLAKVLSRISNCYETAVRIRVAATTVKPTLPPQETAATATATTSSDNAFISVRQLVETLTPESSSRSKKQHSNNAVASALSMLHTYTTPSTLLACLIERYNNSNNSAGSNNNNNNNKHKAQVQQGVLGVLRTWVSVFGGVDDIAEAGVSDALIHFLESVPPDAPVPAPDTFTSQAFTVPGTAQQLRRDVRHGLELRRRRAKALAVPRPRIPLCCEHRSPLELVFMADPTAVAEQLTLVTHTRVAAVRIGELAASAMSTKAVACACAWARPEAQAAVVRSGAGAFAERSALLEQLVGIVALAHGGVEQRAVMLGRLVHVMMHLQKLHNYNDLMCLYAGFRSAPVMQLARTAALMSQEALRGLAVLDRLFAPDGDYKAYRRELEKVAAAADPAEPFIPAFAVVARDVAALNERYPDPPAHGLVSLARCSAFLGCVAPILKCQSRSYRFIVSDPLYSALAELPACTEATLFSLSSLYEPRRHVGFTGV